MNALIAVNLSALEALCRKHRVARLEPFGSAAAGDFDRDRSDLDFLVEFQPVPFGQMADQYFGLLADLQALFDRRVDLVQQGAVRNPYVAASIQRSKVPVYAAA